MIRPLHFQTFGRRLCTSTSRKWSSYEMHWQHMKVVVKVEPDFIESQRTLGDFVPHFHHQRALETERFVISTTSQTF